MLPVGLLDLLNVELAFATSKWAKDRAGNVAAALCRRTSLASSRQWSKLVLGIGSFHRRAM